MLPWTKFSCGWSETVDLGSERAQEMQKPEAEVRGFLDFWETQGRENARFLSSVKLERFKPGSSRSIKDREAMADLWVILHLFLIDLKSKYHCYFQRWFHLVRV